MKVITWAAFHPLGRVEVSCLLETRLAKRRVHTWFRLVCNNLSGSISDALLQRMQSDITKAGRPRVGQPEPHYVCMYVGM
jgi:hypothetical protein